MELETPKHRSKLALLSNVGMKALIFLLIMVVLVLVILYLTVQLLIFVLPLVVIGVLVWLVFRYFDKLKKVAKKI